MIIIRTADGVAHRNVYVYISSLSEHFKCFKLNAPLGAVERSYLVLYDLLFSIRQLVIETSERNNIIRNNYLPSIHYLISCSSGFGLHQPQR